MTDISTQTEAPAEMPVATPEPTSDSYDAIIQEYTEANPPAPEPQPAANESNGDIQGDDIEAFLRELDTGSADRQRIEQRVEELAGLVDSWRAAEHRREELAAFDKVADDLQKDMPSWLPADYTRARLQALAHDPEVCLAWDLRNVDRNAANLELQRVKFALTQTADPAQINQLQQYGARLQAGVNSPAICGRRHWAS